MLSNHILYSFFEYKSIRENTGKKVLCFPLQLMSQGYDRMESTRSIIIIHL